MAELQSKPRESNGGTPHCPYCRDTLQEGVIVQCDSCQTRYHTECATSCVILGCAGTLKDANPKPLSKLTIQEREPAAKNEAAHGAKKWYSQELSSNIAFVAIFSLLFVMLIVGLSSSAPVLISGFVGVIMLAFLFAMIVVRYLIVPKESPDESDSDSTH